MGYSIDEGIVRVDLFKPSGKWYSSHAVDMNKFYNSNDIHDAVHTAWKESGTYPLGLSEGWSIVCLEPYHKHSHPIMVKG